MRKTFCYNFMPSKEEEEKEIARNIPHEVTRTLVEVRDWASTPPRILDPLNPWQIRKLMSSEEVLTGKIVISQEDMFEHVFRYWPLESANYVVHGNKCFVAVVDCTDENSQKRFHGEHVYITSGVNDTYLLVLMDLIRSRGVNPGDEIGLVWDLRSALPNFGAFGFKVLNRRSC